MIKKLDKELELMKSNRNIKDKLIVFSLYNEFYNELIENCNDDHFIKHYVQFMEKTFELVVKRFSSFNGMEASASQVLTLFFEMLKENRLSDLPQARKSIDYFDKDLDRCIVASEYVSIIDKFNALTLEAKVDVMMQYREFLNDMNTNAIELCGDEESLYLRYSIIDFAEIKIKEYLRDSVNNGIDSSRIIRNLRSSMMVSTKEYLLSKFKTGEFGINNFNSRYLPENFDKYNDVEKNMWLMDIIYGISCYDKSNEREKIEEICRILGISKLKYKSMAILKGVHASKVLKKDEK